jgi:YidC/Oxa1 family membrane protein insertase
MAQTPQSPKPAQQQQQPGQQPAEQPKAPSFVLLLLALYALLWLSSRGSTPPAGAVPEPAELAVPVALTGPRLEGPPIRLAVDATAATLGRDGALVGMRVRRFDEELLGFAFTPEKVWQNLDRARPAPAGALDFTAGVHAGRMPFFPSDERRRYLSASVQAGSRTVTFRTEDRHGTVIPKGLSIERRFTLPPQGHRISLEVSVRNHTTAVVDLTARPGGQGPLFVYAGPLLEAVGDYPEVFVRTPTGMETASASESLTEATTGASWIGVRNQYSAFLIDRVRGPARFVHQNVTYRIKGQSKTAPLIGARIEVPFLEPRKSCELAFVIYCGPKVEADLAPEYSPVFNNWDGFTGGLSKMLLSVLLFFYGLTGNYGVSILLLTLVVKVILHPLSFSQFVNMQRMQELQPKIKEIKERYKKPEDVSAKTSELFAKHKVSPVAGCLPMFAQLPIFIALYNCLRGAIEFKGVPFWWLADLSKPDPTTLLPLLFAVSVYFSSKMMQPPAGSGGQDQEMQAMMGKMMPIMMYGMFVWFPVPSGVTIYLAAQSLLGVAETRYNQSKLPRKPGAAPAAPAAPSARGGASGGAAPGKKGKGGKRSAEPHA